METKSITDKKYYELFPLTKRREALRAALKVRRFEIEMYWKRATYFWAFIATAFAGYFAGWHPSVLIPIVLSRY